MTYKKAPVHLTWDANDYKRVTAYFALLVQIDKRVSKTNSSSHTVKEEPKEIEQPKLKPDIWTRDPTGPFFRLFFLVTTFIFNHSLLIKIPTKFRQTMIDTIVLTLNKDLFEIRYPDLFTPSAQMVLFAHDRGITAKQNPTKKELSHGIYKPRLTLSHRINAQGKREITLKIEVSLPKLMFGNNFDELQEQDFPSILTKLAATLEQMGVITTTEALADASLFTVHYSKNIVLTDGSTPYHYINKIKEANIKLSLDVNQTDYRNDGHSYKWHCNSYEIVFYDKIKDLEISQKSDKRALEKDSTLQLPLFEVLKERQNKFEVLRMEVRLNKRAKIKQLYAKLGLPADLSFQSIFKHHFAQTILLHYLDELENTRSVLLDYKASSDKSLLTLLLFNNPDMSTQKILQLFGIKKAFETMNTRELRTMLATRNPNGLASPAVATRVGWYRLMNDVQKVKLPVAHSPFKVIREQLTVFKALRLDRFTQMLSMKRHVVSPAYEQ